MKPEGQSLEAQAAEALAAERTSFEMLYEYAPDGYLVTDSVGLVRRANRMAGELFGVSRGHLINKPIVVFVTPAERSAFRALLRRISAGEGGMFAFEANLEARGGRAFDASIRVATGADELRWTIRDVTEQHRAQRSLSDAHEKLGDRTRELESEIDKRRRTDASLRRSEERYRLLSAHLHEGIEEERTRIARDVHDELGSALTAIRFELSGLRSAAQVDEAVRRAIGRVDAAIRATRRICTDLRPSLLDHMGLWAAIEWLVEDIGGRSGIQCKVELEAGSELEEPARTSVFRIVQEAVTNTVRHAKASTLRVSARGEAGELEIEVADDGRGIRTSELARPDAFGITGMQERARACGGRIVIEPAAQGTRVLLRVPIATGGARCES
jgi:PAS domain S-box-containing protein